jgi:lysophospholipase L1-like esterase
MPVRMIKAKIILTGILFLQLVSASAQTTTQAIDSNFNNSYYQGRMELFNSLPVEKNAIVFLGNSITERGAWSELLPGKAVLNRGIGGDITFGVLARLNEIVKSSPKKLFLLIGINDLSRGIPTDIILRNYEKIINQVKQRSPSTKIYVQSVLPLNDAVLQYDYLKNKKQLILKLNDGIKTIATRMKVSYIDLHPVFADTNGNLKNGLTDDGIHLKPAAYVLWVDYLKKNKYL